MKILVVTAVVMIAGVVAGELMLLSLQISEFILKYPIVFIHMMTQNCIISVAGFRSISHVNIANNM